MVPIVIAAVLWGLCICFKSDSRAVVDILKAHTSRDQRLRHLLCCLRCLLYFSNHSSTSPTTRQQMQSLEIISHKEKEVPQVLIPQVPPRVAIPQPVQDLLTPKGGSRDWIVLFTHSLIKGCPGQQGQPTSWASNSTSDSAA